MFTSNRRVLQALSIIYHKLGELSKNEGVLMAQISDVQTAVAKLSTDVSKGIADANAKLAVLIANQTDPNQAAALQGVVDSLSSIDTAVVGFDTALGT